jgi:hypothetical protein
MSITYLNCLFEIQNNKSIAKIIIECRGSSQTGTKSAEKKNRLERKKTQKQQQQQQQQQQSSN